MRRRYISVRAARLLDVSRTKNGEGNCRSLKFGRFLYEKVAAEKRSAASLSRVPRAPHSATPELLQLLILYMRPIPGTNLK
jgi:hypothetical protein